jgi:hypothetical protein
MEAEQKRMLPEVLKSAFCGRYPGKWKDFSSDAGMVWGIVSRHLSGKGDAEKLKPVEE